MFKKFKVLLVILIGLTASAFFVTPNSIAEAAYGPTTTLYSGCSVRVWTDYTTYSTRATTIDTYAEQNGGSGGCGRLDYKMAVYQIENPYPRSSIQSGYFTYRTPTKYLYLNQMNLGTGFTDAIVSFDIYKNGVFIGSAESARLSIYR